MSELNGRERIAQSASSRRAAPLALPTPKHLRAVAVKPTTVTLSWRGVHVKGHRVTYEIARNGRTIGKPQHHTSFEDRRLAPNTLYRYKVRVRLGRHHGRFTRPVYVRTARLAPPPLPPGMTQAMVDRMFWRAGFGPSAADRAAVDRAAAERARRIFPERALRPRADGDAADLPGQRDRPAGLRPRAADGVARPDAAHDQSLRRANELLLAPPLGGQPRRRDPLQPAARLPRSPAPLRGLRRQSERRVPRSRARDDDPGRGDVDVPDRLSEPQGLAERELRAGVHGAVHARNHRRAGQPQLHPGRRPPARAGVHRLHAQPEHRRRVVHSHPVRQRRQDDPRPDGRVRRHRRCRDRAHATEPRAVHRRRAVE